MAMFDARKAAEEHAAQHGEELFEFVALDGETYYLPPVSSVTAGQVRRLQNGDLAVINEIAGDEASAAIDAMPVWMFEALGEAWAEAGDEAGKSGSPSRPTRTVGTRSKRTSRSAAKR